MSNSSQSFSLFNNLDNQDIPVSEGVHPSSAFAVEQELESTGHETLLSLFQSLSHEQDRSGGFAQFLQHLQIFGPNQHLPHGLTGGSLVEFSGFSGSGKSEMLHQIVASFLLPRWISIALPFPAARHSTQRSVPEGSSGDPIDDQSAVPPQHQEEKNQSPSTQQTKPNQKCSPENKKTSPPLTIYEAFSKSTPNSNSNPHNNNSNNSHQNDNNNIYHNNPANQNNNNNNQKKSSDSNSENNNSENNNSEKIAPAWIHIGGGHHCVMWIDMDEGFSVLRLTEILEATLRLCFDCLIYETRTQAEAQSVHRRQGGFPFEKRQKAHPQQTASSHEDPKGAPFSMSEEMQDLFVQHHQGVIEELVKRALSRFQLFRCSDLLQTWLTIRVLPKHISVLQSQTECTVKLLVIDSLNSAIGYWTEKQDERERNVQRRKEIAKDLSTVFALHNIVAICTRQLVVKKVRDEDRAFNQLVQLKYFFQKQLHEDQNCYTIAQLSPYNQNQVLAKYQWVVSPHYSQIHISEFK